VKQYMKNFPVCLSEM